jgi:chemotaxis response regulator CheB
MTKSVDKKRILLITKNKLVEDSVTKIVNFQTDMMMLDASTVHTDLFPAIATLAPDVILLDYEYQQKTFFGLVDKIATEYPGSAVIVLLPESEMGNSERVILSSKLEC